MLPQGYEGLVVADTRRALAWENGLRRAGFDVVRVETRGADADKGDWQIGVTRSDAPAAKAFVSEVLRGDRELPRAVVMSRSAWISLVAILVIVGGLWLVLALAGCGGGAQKAAATGAPVAAASVTPDAPPASVVGRWVTDDRTTSEEWIEVGSALVGVGFASKDGATGWFEVLFIHDVDGTRMLTAMPGGASQVDFPATGPLAFANPGHDDPKRLVYAPDGDRLAVAIDGDGGRREVAMRAAPAKPAPELEAADRAFAADSRARGGAAWANWFVDDGVNWPRGGTRSAGAASIAAWIDSVRSRGFELAWEPTASGLSPAGDMGFTTGRFELLDSTGYRVGTGTYVSIWRHGPAGWQIVFDTGLPDAG